MRFKSIGHELYTSLSSQTTWPLIWILRSTDNCPTENTTANDYRSLLQSVAFIEILVLYMLSKLWYSWEKKSLLTIKANRCYHWASFPTLLDCVRKLQALFPPIVRVNPAMIFSRTRALYVSTFSSLQAPGVLTRYFVLVGHCKYAGFGFYDFSG